MLGLFHLGRVVNRSDAISHRGAVGAYDRVLNHRYGAVSHMVLFVRMRTARNGHDVCPCTSDAAVSTAAATSPSDGDTRVRPTTRPRTPGSSRAWAQRR